ncbi:LLM class flavin-dependent oxidoreductase [Leifsonia sp. TF02-11]|uniref:LLM class flavin-dependent oxidoreductase n=1 Tax=Leifsonia sp. TF02-11 TaxID=2815212 RepID=UPI001AA10C31|nr:LLM class flavin-dependent oxidoreductase [Leifsonia sp. TF02-11]MBO1739233.1 LLM class flavin-dependent oxidoreductase [Leifsonia sp. TF02-11]
MTRLTRLHFLTPGNYPDDRPAEGLENTLRLIEVGERLGYDGAWVRQRHLEHGISSAAVFLGAATQRTSTIELGTAVIPIGYESPFRLGEDLATADVLSGGRVAIGLSAGTPPHAELIGDRVFDGDWREYDLSYGRIERLLADLSGEFIGDEDTVIHSPGNVQRPRLQPHSPGLDRRVWYGGGSKASIRWAATHGLHLLTGNVISGEGTDDFVEAQRALIALHRSLTTRPDDLRVAFGRVLLPTDNADRTTRKKYREYVRERDARLGVAHGPRRTLFAPDVVGSADEIAERLAEDAAFADVSELRLELPYEFEEADYEQVLHDTIELIAPRFGYVSGSGRAEATESQTVA